MLFKNKYFLYSVSLVVMQQVILAVSTYFIAMAGMALSQNNRDNVLYYIILFFIFALFAYFLSSCSEYTQLKAKNNLWKTYIIDTFNSVQYDMPLSSNKNKQLVTNWLTGEAPITLDNISVFTVELISIYCNVIFTLIVFSITLGHLMAGTMVVSIIVSILLIHLLKNYIKKLANDIQDSKLQYLVNINSLWDNSLFANKNLIEHSHSNLELKSKKYFKKSEKYLIIEQFIACTPIYIAIPLVIIVMIYSVHNYSIELGSIVAVLPRSLQLFGNIHSLSMYNSKALLMKYKSNNLKNFTQRLMRQDLAKQINDNSITIIDTHYNDVPFQQLFDKINSKELKSGRFLITGPNGSGKSSLLKKIKAISPSTTILIAPGINFMDCDLSVSSGEHQVKQTDFVFSQDAVIFLLDEWDANLDRENTIKINEKIEKLANKALIIEIRHKHNEKQEKSTS